MVSDWETGDFVDNQSGTSLKMMGMDLQQATRSGTDPAEQIARSLEQDIVLGRLVPGKSSARRSSQNAFRPRAIMSERALPACSGSGL